MAYFTADELKSLGRTGETIRLAESNTKSVSVASVKVFLAHSHVEVELIEAARKILAANGASIYVDTEDTEMPDKTTPETAAKLKEKIGRFDRFVLLASEASLKSRWVPWELGYADATKGMGKVAILPFISIGSGWRGTEYVGLYATIQPSNGGGIGVFEPNADKGPSLSTWLGR